MKQYICYKPKKVLTSIYGEELGSVLHKVMLGRIELNKRIGVEERWFTFGIFFGNTLMLSNI